MTPRPPFPCHLASVTGLEGGDLAWGWPFDLGPAAARRPRPDRWRRTSARPEHPRAALEALLLDAALRGPVFVSFSGGRDSSALLAVAEHVTRREGLPPPIALTCRYDGDPDADETEWQELVIRHLGVRDWITLDAAAASDALGPWARTVLAAVGHNVFPPASARLGALAVHARGGTLVSGEPGDWVLGPHRMTVVRHVLRSRGRVTRADWVAAAGAVAPAAIRPLLAGSGDAGPTWLTPAAAARRRHALATDARADPWPWDEAVRGLHRRRFYALGFRTLHALTRAYGAEPLDPFGSGRFLDAYASWGGRSGVANRTAAMRLFCGDLLPEEVLRRRSKAFFNRQVFGPATRAFAESWTGADVDTSLVDVERLRAEWLGDRPDGRSLGLLQEAWLAGRQAQLPAAS